MDLKRIETEIIRSPLRQENLHQILLDLPPTPYTKTWDSEKRGKIEGVVARLHINNYEHRTELSLKYFSNGIEVWMTLPYQAKMRMGLEHYSVRKIGGCRDQENGRCDSFLVTF